MAWAKLDEAATDELDPEIADWFYQVVDNFQELTGFIFPAGFAAPTGFHDCDGASLAVADYPELFARIGYTWGGSGANFNLPDLRGRTAIGVGTGSGLTARALAASGGEESHALTEAEVPQHLHMANRYTAGAGASDTGTIGPYATPIDHLNTDGQGSGSAHQTMAPFLVCDWWIKL